MLASALSGLVGVQKAFAVTTTTNFACADGTTGTKITSNTKNHSVVVTCSNGSKIEYLNYQNDGLQPVSVAVTCPGNQQIDPEVDAPNQQTSKYTFYCVTVTGSGEHATSKRTTSNPTAKTAAATVVTCPDGKTPKNNNVQNCSTNSADDNVVSDPAAKGNCADINKCDLINNYVNPFINFLAALVGVGVVMGIVIGGIQYGSSAGDPQKVNAAKNRIRNALMALVAFLFLYTLLNFLVPGGLL